MKSPKKNKAPKVVSYKGTMEILNWPKNQKVNQGFFQLEKGLLNKKKHAQHFNGWKWPSRK
jgi:hypothetical protein